MASQQASTALAATQARVLVAKRRAASPTSREDMDRSKTAAAEQAASCLSFSSLISYYFSRCPGSVGKAADSMG